MNNFAELAYEELQYRGHRIGEDGTPYLVYGTDLFPYALILNINAHGWINQVNLTSNCGEDGTLRFSTITWLTLKTKMPDPKRAPEAMAAEAVAIWRHIVAPRPLNVLRGTINGMQEALKAIAILSGKSTRIECLKKRSSPWRPLRRDVHPIAMHHVFEWHMPEGSVLDRTRTDNERAPYMIGCSLKTKGSPPTAHDKLEHGPTILRFYEAFDADPLTPKPGSKAVWTKSKEAALAELGL